MKTFMFPGQGSQTKGMGEGLFDRFPEITQQANDILGYSIKELCLEDATGELAQTQYTQPALYTVNALSYFDRMESGAAEPDFLAGHSLGEFNALLAAECFDFPTGLRLVQKRGQLMSEASGGGMAAIINASREHIENTLAEHGLQEVYLANYNSPAQIVVSGPADDMSHVPSLFKGDGVRCFPLNTSGAFHSRLMEPAMEQFREFIKEYNFSEPKIPVISNVTAAPYDSGDIVSTLASQIANTVRWSDTIRYLLALARYRGDNMEFEEIGPGEVLTGLVDATQQQTPSEVLHQYIPQRDPGAQRSSSKGGGKKTQAKRSKKDDSNKNTSNNAGNASKRGKKRSQKGASGNTTRSDDTARTPDTSTGESQVEVGQGSQSSERNEAASAEESKLGERKHISGARGATEKVKNWNDNYPIGTKVRSTIIDDDDLETRTEAIVLFGHRAAVYMKGYNGYFDLDEIEPVQ